MTELGLLPSCKFEIGRVKTPLAGTLAINPTCLWEVMEVQAADTRVWSCADTRADMSAAIFDSAIAYPQPQPLR